jgi:hypothetical protein
LGNFNKIIPNASGGCQVVKHWKFGKVCDKIKSNPRHELQSLGGRIMAIKQSKDYYTPAQVKEILGITDSELYTYVDNGALERIIPIGKKQGVYRRDQVDDLAKNLKISPAGRKRVHIKTKFLPVTTEEEMIACQEISQQIFGVGLNTVKERMKLVAKNPITYHFLRDDNSQEVVGYLAIMPLKVGRLKKVLSQDIPVKISADDLEDFNSKKEIELYLHAIAVKPGFSPEVKKLYGARLVDGLMKLILRLGKQGIAIKTVAARSYTPDGIRMMRHMGFTEIAPVTPKRRTFIIDVEMSGIPFILTYKSLLKNRKSNSVV